LKEKKGIVVIVILSIILLVSLFLGKLQDNKLMDKNSEEYKEWVNSSKDDKVVPVEEKLKNQVTELDFYSKLIKKETVKILIAGDRIALSEGKNSDNGIWTEGVSYIINKNYGSEVELTLLASQEITIKGGQDLINKNDTSNQDLIILCFGHNDSIAAANVQEFKSTYSKIISDIKSKNENQKLLLIIPSTLDNADKYRETILAVAEENGLAYVDTKAAMDNSKLSKKSILNGKLPSDIGYQLYTESFSNVINEEVQKQNG